MTQEFSTDDLTDTELLKKCIMSLSDTILYTNALIERQYKLEVKRDEMRRVSKLKALCGLPDEPVKQEQQRKIKNIDMSKFRGNNEQGKQAG